MRRTLTSLARSAVLASDGRELVTVLVPAPDGRVMDTYLFHVDRAASAVRVVERRQGVRWSEIAPAHPALARTLPPVVVAAAPQAAVTLTATARVSGVAAGGGLQRDALQEMLKKLQVDLWAEYRPRIAAQLGVEPIDAVLAAFRVLSVAVGGAEVVSMEEVGDRDAEVTVLVRFVARDTFERARETTPAPFFADPAWTLVAGEASIASAVLLAAQDPAVLVADRPSRGVRELARVPLAWSARDVARELEIRWGVSAAVATEVLRAHVAGETVGSVRAGIEVATERPRRALYDELRTLRVRGELPIVTAVPFPPGEGREQVAIRSFNPADVLRSTGMVLEGTANVRSLAALVEFYYSERYSDLNAWLSKRITWLGSAAGAQTT